jgi:hypothetical protein
MPGRGENSRLQTRFAGKLALSLALFARLGNALVAFKAL